MIVRKLLMKCEELVLSTCLIYYSRAPGILFGKHLQLKLEEASDLPGRVKLKVVVTNV